MIKYEYKVVKYQHWNKDISNLTEEELINKYASQGWELVCPQLYNKEFSYLYFKRQLNGKG